MVSTQLMSVSKLKTYARLKDRKFRHKEGIFLIEGHRAVSQVLRLGIIHVLSVIKSNEAIIPPEVFSIIPAAAPIYEVTASDFKLISDTETSQGVACVAQIPTSLDTKDLQTISQKPLLALDAISDPGNLGTLYRTAAWFNFGGFILGEGTADLFNPKVVRSTAGAIGSLAYASANLKYLIIDLLEAGWEAVALDVNVNAASVYSIKPNSKTILVIGNEAHGISEEIKSLCTCVYIPGNPEYVESLNASVAASVAMSHIHNMLM